MMKKMLLWVTVLCFVWCGVFVEAKTQNVADQADILSESEEIELNAKIEEAERVTGWDVMAVTTDETDGKSSRVYAEDWYEFYSDSEDGAICLIDMENRMLYISTFGVVIDYLTDARIDEILDYAYVGASDGLYGESFSCMIEKMSDMYKRGIPKGQYQYDVETGMVVPKEKKITSTEMFVSLCAALVAGIGSAVFIVGRYKMKWGTYRYSYRENGKLELTNKKDILESTNVIHRRIPKPSSSSGARSSTHRTSSGRRSGGGGRKF